MSSPPNPLMRDRHKSHSRGKCSMRAKPIHRISKRSSHLQEHGAAVVDRKSERVWKACERCRLKKTKCDGESPCKRCKDDGVVCTAGNGRKFRLKQLPTGYAEVLESTQHTLIAIVQKLYTMIRNNESWDWGEPEMNDRGQPVIHDIASKLGCIRHYHDLPVTFAESAEDFAELQAQPQAARSEMDVQDTGNRKLSGTSPPSPHPALTEGLSSTESDHSVLFTADNQIPQQWQAATKVNPPVTIMSTRKPTPLTPQRNFTDDKETYSSAYLAQAFFDANASIRSPPHTDFQTQSLIFRKQSRVPSWIAADDSLGDAHAVDMTAQFPSIPGPSLDGSLDRQIDLVELKLLKAIQSQDRLNLADGTIAPHLLDCRYDPRSQLSNIFSGNEYESQMGGRTSHWF